MAAPNAGADNHLAYIDQAAFLGLRALGRSPLIQYTWVYEHPVDLHGLRRFHANLGRGLLGRRIEPSPVPFGRHRWVAWPGPSEMDLADTQLDRDAVAGWADEQLEIPIDPEHGPAWRLAVQPLSGGGAAVTFIISHTVCDGLAAALAVSEAAQGITRDLGYPPPNSRLGRTAIKQDLGTSIRSVPEMARAVVDLVRLARKNKEEISSSAARSSPPDSLHGSRPVTIPSVTAYIDLAQWDNRAESLGGSSNALFAGVAARLGEMTGRLDGQGNVKLSFPVSERIQGDTRGNALTAMTLTVDPAGLTASLSGVRAEIKRNLEALGETRHELLAPLPLTPLVPRRLARRLEGMALGSGSPVGCSNLGTLDPAVNRPDGSDAEYFSVRQMESRITPDILDRMGGSLFLASGRVNGRVFLAVEGWQVGGENTKKRLAELVLRVLSDFGLSAEIE